jgi:phosphatidylglycerophosphatase A
MAPGRPLPRRRRSRGAPPTAVPTRKVIETPENAREISAPSDRLALFVATGAGSGYAPIVPGTFGSAVGVALTLALAGLGPWLYLLASIALLSLGIWAADEAERAFGQKDDRRIVIDEIVGQLLTYAPLVVLGVRIDWRWLVTGFVLFRLLDIWKPGPARWAEQSFAGGAGVMLDDVIAGLMGAVLMGIAVSALG